MKYILLFCALFLAGCTGVASPENSQVTVCPADEKVCPDGVSVSRIPPECEFAECSITGATPATPFQATFTIYTNGIRRDFGLPMYLRQSKDAYIDSADNPGVIRVTKVGTTWKDFFDTLPFSVTKDCLITGDGDTLCTNEAKTLRFSLNGEESPDALERIISEGDELIIEYN